MARAIARLTAVGVAKRAKAGRHADGGGLHLCVSPTGRKSWVFIWTRLGKRREMGLGPYPAIFLKAARDKATQCSNPVAKGLDPIVERNREGNKTFGECADLYIATVEPRWRNGKHRCQWRQTLGAYCGPIRNRLVGTIPTRDALSVLQPLWTTKGEIASRLRYRRVTPSPGT